jgi:hypothetical protein
VSTLAHVFEAAGIATIALGSVRKQIESTAPPRGLWCDFPLGRPLGRPGDAAFVRIADGTDWKAAGVPGLPMRVAHDIRSYYETASLAMVDHAPAAWAGTRWFYDQTETGKVMLAARSRMREQGAPQPMWFYLTPGDR